MSMFFTPIHRSHDLAHVQSVVWPLTRRSASIADNLFYVSRRAKKKFCLALQLSLTARIAPKICQSQLDNVLKVLQISSRSVHFQRSYSRTREHRQNAP